ncbi:MAG: hypothetical protein K0U41_02295 [Gammaproteobacteria bacterium]|nr:hypothetical protein [Gammaproteobacteria bacterium]
MPELFGIDIAGIVAQEIGPRVLPATLIVITRGPRDPADPTEPGPEIRTPHPCRGFIEDYDDDKIDGTLVQRGDRLVTLIGGTLPSGIIPTGSDKVTIEDSTYNVERIKRDPAAATYQCQVRGLANS